MRPVPSHLAMRSLDESAKILAKIAVDEQFVDASTIGQVIEKAAPGKPSTSLAKTLLDLGHISEQQFKQLMSLHYAACSDAERSDDLKLFGQAVLSRGLATPREIADALKQQAQLSARGVHKNLGEILVEIGAMSVEQVKSLLQEQDKAIMYCPECAERYNVLRRWQDSAQCPADGSPLARTTRDGDLGVAATLHRPAATETSPIGIEVGGCRLVEVIGRGAMGTVYKAKHVGLGRYVAIKMMPTTSQDDSIAKRLLFEARAIAKLEHPNIVQVYDTGFQGNHFFMVMQLLRGRTLEDLQKDIGGPTLNEVISIGADIASGLEAAHESGIIHRDLKPANIFLTDDGRARLTDFGLAQDQDKPDELSGYIVGTPNYMSPEQWLGKTADARSDLYSLGVILYQLAAGRKPFEGKTQEQLREAHLKKKAPSLRELNSEVTPGMAVVIRKLLAKDRKKRYQNAKELLDDLGKLRRGEDPAAMAQFGNFVKCGFCETLNPVGTRKCTVCNEPLAQNKSGLHIAMRHGEFECPSCQAVNADGARSCIKCRRLFCASCGIRIVTESGPCYTCRNEGARGGN